VTEFEHNYSTMYLLARCFCFKNTVVNRLTSVFIRWHLYIHDVDSVILYNIHDIICCCFSQRYTYTTLLKLPRKCYFQQKHIVWTVLTQAIKTNLKISLLFFPFELFNSAVWNKQMADHLTFKRGATFVFYNKNKYFLIY